MENPMRRSPSHASGRLGTDVPPPRAEQRPWTGSWHGIEISDPWHWLRDPGYPEVTDPDILAWLEAENAWFETIMAPCREQIDALFDEIRGRQKEDDASVPWADGDWVYRWRFEAGGQYRIWSRWPRNGSPEEESVILDEPALAADLDYFRLGALEISPDGARLAWSADSDGSERFTLRVHELEEGRDLEERIPDTLGAPVWTAAGDAFYYVVVNDSWRPYQVRLHRPGSPVAEDRVIYTEEDESFFVGLGQTLDRAFVIIASGDHVTSEARLIPTDQPEEAPRLVAPRRSGHEYDLEHAHGRLWIRTNDVHRNFRLVSAAPDAPGEAHWREEIPPSDHDYLTGVDTFADFMVVSERRDGLDQIRIRGYGSDAGGGPDEHFVDFPEAAYVVGLGTNAEFDTASVRLGYASMVTPDTVHDYHVAERRLEVRKVREIPSGYDPSAYVTERLWIEARDGARVPVSVVHRRDFPLDGSGLLKLYGYGAYGHAVPPAFSAAVLSLLDRGFAFAIAHIRGGDDLGYGWYEDGKLDRRENTFNDFVDVARGLVERGYAGPGRIAISGGSAGGELMGAVMNQAPELWGAVVSHVPFVDVLQTMLDPSLPLTPIEWPEWGNPIESREAFEWIARYSPYDNVRATDYPPLMVTAGINDPRVTYWEPAKWVAKQRALRTDREVMVLKTNMNAGHGGVSGRWDALREVAEEYAFILSVLDVSES
jgi:oligopeptidase B